MSRRPPGLWTRIRRRLYIDAGRPQDTIFVAGMGRSGTTWLAAVINHDFSYRMVFEPFRPHVVPEAKEFGPFAYVSPGDRHAERRRAAETILSGRTPRGTLDRHRGIVFRRRLIKDVRCNLMLGWLKSVRPAMPVILIVRNPFAVTASWIRLGWGRVADGSRSELDVILGHPELLRDFPVIGEAITGVDRSDAFERIMAQWAILHLVPFQQLGFRDAHLVMYEDLVREPVAEVARLAEYLGTRIDGPGRDHALRTPAETDFGRDDAAPDRTVLLDAWKTFFTPAQIERGQQILASFGVGDVYDPQGAPSKALLDRRPAYR